MKSEDIRRFSGDEVKARRAHGESRTDLELVRRQSEAEVEAQIAADDDFKDVPQDWYLSARAVRPSKTLLSLRLDKEVVDWFKAQGAGYQTKMNTVLLAFVRHQNSR